MALSTSVKYFHSLMTGATAGGITPGTLIALLDSCLVTGFGVKTASTVTVASGIATVNIAAGGHSFEKDVVMLVSGATPAGLNGEKRVLTTGTTNITFDATGITDQVATGTIIVKMAPVGWEKAFSGTNVAVYRSTDVTGTRMFLRVDDTGTINAMVAGYESMSDVDTGTGRFPSTVQMPGGFYWPKGNQPIKAWTLIADSKTFYLHTHANVDVNVLGIGGWVAGFGDFSSLKSGDAYSCFITGATTNIASNTGHTPNCLTHVVSTLLIDQTGVAIARAYTGLGGSAIASKICESYFPYVSGFSGYSSAAALYPNPVDNSLLVSNYLLMEAGPSVRGRLPGILFLPQSSHTFFEWRQKLDGQGHLAGRQLMTIKGAAPITSTSYSMCLFDIIGPWG
jgi:hypothetical protein